MSSWKNFYSSKHYALLVLLSMMSSFVTAQHRSHEKLESVRIALITERLALTPEVAQRFWPIYNQVSEERTKLKREGSRQRRLGDTDSLNSEQAQARVEAYFELKKRELALEEEAATQYATVLSPPQVLQLLRVEREFQRMMLKQLGRRGRRSVTDGQPRQPRISPK